MNERTVWQRLVDGAMSPWRGLVYLVGRPRLWLWVAAPVLVFVAVAAPTAWWTWSSLPARIAGIAPPPDVAPLIGLWWVAVMVLCLVVFVGLAAAEWVVVSAITRPAYGVVTGIVEDEIDGTTTDLDLGTLLTDAGWSVVHSLLALAAYGALSVVASSIVFVPGLGELVAPVLGLLLSIFWLARELVDGPLSKRRLGFRAKLQFIRDHWPEMLGLGAATWAGLVVPVVDLVVLPAAFVGATLWYATRRERAS